MPRLFRVDGPPRNREHAVFRVKPSTIWEQKCQKEALPLMKE